jgi:aryl-alcohol dehydrogenase-like predicted oxidoreductase
MAELRAEGKIKYLGLSEVSAETVRRASAVAHIDAVQVENSPWFLDIEKPTTNLLKTSRILGIAIVGYSPIGRGMLSGTFQSPDDLEEGDSRRLSSRFQPENFGKNVILVNEIVALAKKKSITATQLTLAWLMAQGEDIIPIPETTKIEGLKENLAALNVQLTKGEVQEMRTLVDAAEIHGSRYPEAHLKFVFGDTPKEQVG